MANSVDPDQSTTGSTLFASILNSSVMLGNYLQQTTSADDIFRSIFFLALQGLTMSWDAGTVSLKFSLTLLIPTVKPV